MKTYKLLLSFLFLGSALTACEDFLNQEPPSLVVPEDYYRTEDQIQACVNRFYPDILPSHGNDYGIYAKDGGTDNQANQNADIKYATGQWKVEMENDNWSWNLIRDINYQLTSILDRQNNGLISGNVNNIRHYIGELYFMRAFQYFKMLMQWGDLPILTEALPDNEQVLVSKDIRSPRNEVARFILKDLDSSLEYMVDKFENRHTRISPDVATLVKSRVALFEASWLTYFKDSPFVPNGEGWPGKTKNPNYNYPSGDIDSEIRHFLTIAVEASEQIAEKYKGNLVMNTGVIPQSESDPINPYFNMFGTTDMSIYPEVLLWREYNDGMGITNSVEDGVQRGNRGTGVTRGLIESFLMEDGKPIYASHNGYVYDDASLTKVRENRDPRLSVFLKVPGQVNCFKNMDYDRGDRMIVIEPEKPDITNGSKDWAYTTGYALRKGGTFDRAQCTVSYGANAACCFRATEALLNYMEAQYMLTGSLSEKTIEYWKIIREKAGFKGVAIDPQTTIVSTDMQKEKLDWGAFSGGKLIEPTLYNIRRERRCEFMGEGLRWMDLIRWRSLDQLMTNNYHIEGFRLWNSDMTSLYNFNEDNYNGSSSANVSSPSLSDYLRPYEKNMSASNFYRDGYTWHMAHYLQPLPIKEFQLTATDHISVELSTLYQNPYWPVEAGSPAEQ